MHIGKRIIVTVIILIVGAVSFWGMGPWAENPETYTETTAKIEDLQDNALVLTATATGMATAAALVPGDSTTPVANKLADVAGYMVIVYAALTMEKYMMTLTGALLFRLIIPILSLIALFIIWLKNAEWRGRLSHVSAKILLVGVVLWALVPASMHVSIMVQDMYNVSAEAKLEQVEEENKQLESEAKQSKASTDDEDSSFLAKWFEKAKEKVNDAKTSVKQKAKEFEAVLDNLIEGVAVLIVTTCVIPLAVMVLMLWLVKLIAAPGTKFVIPRMPQTSKVISRKKELLENKGEDYE